MRINAGLGYVLDRYPRVLRPLASKWLKSLPWHWVDTAFQYGEGRSELQAGKYFSAVPNITIKLGLGYGLSSADTARWQGPLDADNLREMFKSSLGRTERQEVGCLLLHCPGSVSDISTQVEMMRELKNLGLVKSIGVSIDTLGDLPADDGWIDAIQLPIGLASQFQSRNFSQVFLTGLGRSGTSFHDLQELVSKSHWAEVTLLSGSKWPHRQIALVGKAKRLGGCIG